MNFKRSWSIFAVAVLAVLPSLAQAEVSVVQDSCIRFEDAGKQYLRVHFSVVNFNAPFDICDLHFIPEGDPVDPGCVMVGCSAPDGWTCGLRNLDGGADYEADTPGDCIAAGNILRGFTFVLDPEFCCYIVQFTDANGGVFAQQEECFSCVHVGTEDRTWGNVKRLFR
jgi:hypothetical protein